MSERKLAVSKAGHDKGKIYVIVREDENSFYLADGKSRTAERPKKKNRKHVQPVLHLPEVVEELLDAEVLDDPAIRKAIRQYRKSISDNA